MIKDLFALIWHLKSLVETLKCGYMKVKFNKCIYNDVINNFELSHGFYQCCSSVYEVLSSYKPTLNV